MELGPIQKMWIQSLREHPERQMTCRLGKGKSADDYKACCLGELLFCFCERKFDTVFHKTNPEDENFLMYDIDPISRERNDHRGILIGSWDELGLFDHYGSFKGTARLQLGEKQCSSLSGANDNGVTWPEIADFVEANPEMVFTKSY